MKKEYVVRKVKPYKNGKYKVYLEGKGIFRYYLTTDSSIKKYSIVVIVRGKTIKSRPT